jgi:hypothetical protein
MSIYNRIKEYIPNGEEILAVIESKPMFGTTGHIFVATERRLAEICKTSLFGWGYKSEGWEQFLYADIIEEGLLRCTIKLTLKKIDEKTGKAKSFKIPDVGKKEGRYFVKVAQKCIDEHDVIIAYKSKRCPECDEIVKFLAKKCKHCGYMFE